MVNVGIKKEDGSPYLEFRFDVNEDSSKTQLLDYFLYQAKKNGVELEHKTNNMFPLENFKINIKK